jgi:hypothetical protein
MAKAGLSCARSKKFSRFENSQNVKMSLPGTLFGKMDTDTILRRLRSGILEKVELSMILLR